ncbi:hypothetical protein [Streptosporangium sp. NPDC051022]|uniref:hypothetical protein n=1 Tax=Streptosporangium sp. NPDC051022 TaxID=3155752 RepID=UPI003447E52B
MRWYGFWNGGNGYGPSDPDDLEEFASIADARRKLLERHRYGYRQTSVFAFVHRESVRALTPCVGDDCEITLYGSATDLSYPARRVYLGKRGGTRIDPC